MLIRVAASPKLTRWGRFSLTVKHIELSGEGAVKKAFELLRAKFEAEGLFAPERKRALPAYPRQVALITSAQAAAYNDFLTVVGDRWPYLSLDHAQVQVQGMEASAQVTAAIAYFNRQPERYDALVVIRGGGSMEDLQAFNHEDVVRAVYGSKIPTLVAIGHEDDTTLAELAADVRGATPTDAARRLVPEHGEVRANVNHQLRRGLSAVDQILSAARYSTERFFDVFAGLLGQLNNRLDNRRRSLAYAMDQTATKTAQWLYSNRQMLGSLNPMAVLQRGYAIAMVRGTVVKRAADIRPTDKVVVQLWQGKVILRKVDDKPDEPGTQIRAQF